MTRNQLAYHTLQETIRSNLANEGIKIGQHEENVRHNKISESHVARQNEIQGNLAKSQQFKNYVTGVSGAIKDVAGAAGSIMGIPSVTLGGQANNVKSLTPLNLDPHAQMQHTLNNLNYRDLRLGSLN